MTKPSPKLSHRLEDLTPFQQMKYYGDHDVWFIVYDKTGYYYARCTHSPTIPYTIYSEVMTYDKAQKECRTLNDIAYMYRE